MYWGWGQFFLLTGAVASYVMAFVCWKQEKPGSAYYDTWKGWRVAFICFAPIFAGIALFLGNFEGNQQDHRVQHRIELEDRYPSLEFTSVGDRNVTFIDAEARCRGVHNWNDDAQARVLSEVVCAVPGAPVEGEYAPTEEE